VFAQPQLVPLNFEHRTSNTDRSPLNILVTGGAGYIGSVLVPLLLAEGHSVTVVDNFMYGQPSLLDCCVNKKLDIIRGDVRDKELLSKLVAKADAIFTLACLVGAPICAKEPETANAVNFAAVKTITELMSPRQQLIFPSTNSGYGLGQPDIYCDENTPLRPISLYGQLKVDLESLLLDKGNCITFRFATLFGISPRMRLDLLVNDFTYRAVTDRCVILFEPHFKRNYLHVRDAARAFVHALNKYEEMKGRPYNVGLSDANLSKLELCQVIQKQIPDFCFLAAEFGKDPDQRNYIVSNERMEVTGFRPCLSLEDGIDELIKGFQIIRRNQFSNV
jgi:nucleoside-diphosphate-sugar epimerase